MAVSSIRSAQDTIDPVGLDSQIISAIPAISAKFGWRRFRFCGAGASPVSTANHFPAPPPGRTRSNCGCGGGDHRTNDSVSGLLPPGLIGWIRLEAPGQIFSGIPNDLRK
jgi:hypothetical protein